MTEKKLAGIWLQFTIVGEVVAQLVECSPINLLACASVV